MSAMNQSSGEGQTEKKVIDKEIATTLGKLVGDIKDYFCCGGVIDNSSDTSIVYKTGLPNQWKELAFPASSEADLKQLADAASVASFGIGSEQVTDPAYRNALKLDASDFVTPFCPYSHAIVDEIVGTLVPHVKRVKAELYKFNIYGTGGFFKPHVDTPRSQDMFGSLVVCFPSQFTGGELVARHHGKEVTFDWSKEHCNSTKWAAFFSNVEHEILPVTGGHRITLTYNLYNPEKSVRFNPSSVNISPTPLHSELQAALMNKDFMVDGGVLGFATHHTYVFPDLNEEKRLPLLLKGADQIIFQLAISLGLEVMVKPIVKGDASYWWRDGRLLVAFPNMFCDYLDEGTAYNRDDENEANTVFEYLFKVKPCDIGEVSWCEEHTLWQPAGATVTYGNEYTSTCFYQAAAILVGIPHWNKESNSRAISAEKNAIIENSSISV